MVVIANRFICLLALIVPLSLAADTTTAVPCEEQELWFEAGIGFYANGYSLEGTEKRTRSLYKTMKGEPLTEDEAVATALQAWHFLDEKKASTDIGQIERLMLAQRYYAQCLERANVSSQNDPDHLGQQKQ